MSGDSRRFPSPFEKAAATVRKFPTCPGVYLMKNAAGVVIYVGKATNLRSRAGSYFLKAALTDSKSRLNRLADRSLGWRNR